MVTLNMTLYYRPSQLWLFALYNTQYKCLELNKAHTAQNTDNGKREQKHKKKSTERQESNGEKNTKLIDLQDENMMITLSLINRHHI